MSPSFLTGFLLLATTHLSYVVGRQASKLQESLFPERFLAENVTHSLNVSTCPGVFEF